MKCNGNTICLDTIPYLNCKNINEIKLKYKSIFQNKLAFSKSKDVQKRQAKNMFEMKPANPVDLPVNTFLNKH